MRPALDFLGRRAEKSMNTPRIFGVSAPLGGLKGATGGTACGGCKYR
jgi:hypothetical protein